MKRRGRVRRVAKWTGLAACVLIAAAWGLSLKYWVGRTSVVPGKGVRWIVLTKGVVALVWDGDPGQFGDPTGGTDWSWLDAGPHPPVRWSPGTSFDGVVTSSWMPLWMPLVCMTIPTAWLWYRDRRVKPGRCANCGYDLAGLTPGAACPECGSGESSQQQSSTLN